ncbi:hypothetical protein K469DRAFT_698184 [Zopfia rhizophila CBS 207.26]|uniref:Uncharacterized protein n=1 Tax=Zopfia rhizophila CBS 207.26 TaxID=1314779 RepID=A0A6A6DGY6_9PEZI|nr:hypothetical protein K469DRAFT_698184 [Zopfia rhizophila CBS 207.26]
MLDDFLASNLITVDRLEWRGANKLDIRGRTSSVSVWTPSDQQIKIDTTLYHELIYQYRNDPENIHPIADIARRGPDGFQSEGGFTAYGWRIATRASNEMTPRLNEENYALFGLDTGYLIVDFVKEGEMLSHLGTRFAMIRIEEPTSLWARVEVDFRWLGRSLWRAGGGSNPTLSASRWEIEEHLDQLSELTVYSTYITGKMSSKSDWAYRTSSVVAYYFGQQPMITSPPTSLVTLGNTPWQKCLETSIS